MLAASEATTASEIKCGLRFEISGPNYLLIHMHIAHMIWALMACHHSLQTASEVKFDLRFGISDPNYLLIHVHFVVMVWALFGSL